MSVALDVQNALTAKIKSLKGWEDINISDFPVNNPKLPYVTFGSFWTDKTNEFDRIIFDMRVQIDIWSKASDESKNIKLLTSDLEHYLLGKLAIADVLIAEVLEIKSMSLLDRDGETSHGILTLTIEVIKWQKK
ncbi:DUF3168 domain-containing protein [Bartonella sp. DGB1]|uniref:tail completion protein gp17 n=1 Tax=Bartonella sp. DGB1 TaxID=3239807 RepID=UPI003524F83E